MILNRCIIMIILFNIWNWIVVCHEGCHHHLHHLTLCSISCVVHSIPYLIDLHHHEGHEIFEGELIPIIQKDDFLAFLKEWREQRTDWWNFPFWVLLEISLFPGYCLTYLQVELPCRRNSSQMMLICCLHQQVDCCFCQIVHKLIIVVFLAVIEWFPARTFLPKIHPSISIIWSCGTIGLSNFFSWLSLLSTHVEGSLDLPLDQSFLQWNWISSQGSCSICNIKKRRWSDVLLLHPVPLKSLAQSHAHAQRDLIWGTDNSPSSFLACCCLLMMRLKIKGVDLLHGTKVPIWTFFPQGTNSDKNLSLAYTNFCRAGIGRDVYSSTTQLCTW